MYTNNDYNEYTPGGLGGVSIQGKWINKRTGEEIYVRDNIITEQGMQLMTSVGMISMTEFSRDYIQASEEEYTPQYNSTGDIIGTSVGVSKPLDNPLAQTITPKDNDNPLAANKKQDIDEFTYYNESVLNSELSGANPLETVFTPKPSSENYALIEKLFNKLNTKPEIKLTVNWADFPKQELKTLIEYLDVDKDSIASYIFDNFADRESIKEEIVKYLNKMI